MILLSSKGLAFDVSYISHWFPSVRTPYCAPTSRQYMSSWETFFDAGGASSRLASTSTKGTCSELSNA